MGIRTGQQYLDKLNSMHPHVVIDGVTVTKDIADYPAFRNVARTYAQLYDMQFSPGHQQDLTYTSPATGDLVNASFLVPRNLEDLEHRRAAISGMGRLLQRIPRAQRRLHELSADRAVRSAAVVRPGRP